MRKSKFIRSLLPSYTGLNQFVIITIAIYHIDMVFLFWKKENSIHWTGLHSFLHKTKPPLHFVFYIYFETKCYKMLQNDTKCCKTNNKMVQMYCNGIYWERSVCRRNKMVNISYWEMWDCLVNIVVFSITWYKEGARC